MRNYANVLMMSLREYNKKKIAVCEMVDATEVSEEHALES